MNKKLSTIAVAAMLAAPAGALAQASNVQIYVPLNVGLDNYSAAGAAADSTADFKSRYRVYNAASRLGFTGSEDLGNGLKAVFQMESGVIVDSGGNTGQSGVNNPFAGFLSSRIGHVGLQGNWGLLTFGKSNVWWANYAQERVTANFIAAGMSSFNGLMGRGMGVGVTRVSNAMQYTSPAFSGVSAIVRYSPNGDASQASWGLNWEHRFGNIRGFAQWAKVNNITGCVIAGNCANTNAKSWLLAARYNLSKRTGAYVQYTTTSNAANYNMDYTGSRMTSAGTLGLLPGLPPGSVGADPRMYGAGIMHNF